MNKLKSISSFLTKYQWTLSLAESCTGGVFSSLLTSLPGASLWLKEALVVYSLESKVERLGISLLEINKHGVVSSNICIKMAENTKKLLNTDLGMGITGSAGPDSYPGINPGQVYIALSSPRQNLCKSYQFSGSRLYIQDQSSRAALDLLFDHLNSLESSNL